MIRPEGPQGPAERAATALMDTSTEAGDAADGGPLQLQVSRSLDSLPASARSSPGRPVTASGRPVIRVPSSRVRSPIRRHDPDTLLTDVPKLMLPLWQHPQQGISASRSLVSLGDASNVEVGTVTVTTAAPELSRVLELTRAVEQVRALFEKKSKEDREDMLYDEGPLPANAAAMIVQVAAIAAANEMPPDAAASALAAAEHSARAEAAAILASAAAAPPASEFAASVYNYFVRRFGMRSLAQHKMVALFDAVRAMRQVPLLRLFGRFLVLFPEASPTEMVPLGDSSIQLFLEARRWLKEHDFILPGAPVPQSLASHGARRRPASRATTAGNLDIRWELMERVHALLFVQGVLGGWGVAPVVMEACLDRLEGMPYGTAAEYDLEDQRCEPLTPRFAGPLPGSREGLVDADLVMEVMLEEAAKGEGVSDGAVATLFGQATGAEHTITPRHHQEGEGAAGGAEGNVEPHEIEPGIWDATMRLLRRLLLAFIAKDGPRSGMLDAADAAEVMRSGSWGWPMWLKPNMAMGNNERVLKAEGEMQSLISLFRDRQSRGVCYLDLWAMLFVEASLAGAIPGPTPLLDLARDQKVGIDGSR